MTLLTWISPICTKPLPEFTATAMGRPSKSLIEASRQGLDFADGLDRVERVVEVTFGQLEGGRFRHGVKFQRWRPDRTPESCRYEQLDVAAPVRFDELLAESG